MPTEERRQQLIAQFRALPGQVEVLVGNLSDAQLTAEAIPGEWTIAQIVHHLADTHMNAFYRFKRILLMSEPAIDSFDQTLWAGTPEATKADIADSLTILHALHHRWAVLMESLELKDWARTARHREVGQIVLYDVLDAYVDHGKVHLKQINDLINAMK